MRDSIDRDVREKASNIISQHELQFADTIERGAPITVVYGIITPRETSGSFRLPLFSLINLEHFASTIRRHGFSVRISFIELKRN